MEIFHAQQSRQIAESVNSSRPFKTERAIVNEAIRQATEKGHFVARVPLVLTDSVSRELRNAGYVVVSKPDGTEVVW